MRKRLPSESVASELLPVRVFWDWQFIVIYVFHAVQSERAIACWKGYPYLRWREPGPSEKAAVKRCGVPAGRRLGLRGSRVHTVSGGLEA